MRTQGFALDGLGSPLPLGTPIHTFVDGVDYSNGTRVFDALGSYSVLTEGNWRIGNASETPWRKEGADDGDLVLFAAGDFTASAEVFQETMEWHKGFTVTQNLHLGALGTTPNPLKIRGLVTQPARGGNQSAYVCNPTLAAVDLSRYFLELNRPNRYDGPRLALTGTVPARGDVRIDLGSDAFLDPKGDAMKLVFENPGGLNASAGGRDIVVDRVEYNATVGGTLTWEPGNTIMGDAAAPGIGRILTRSPDCRDTNMPSDFRIDIEPGLPPNGPPSVALLTPVGGETLQAGAPFTVRWNMSDDLFETEVLEVWVNVTYAGTTSTLLDGLAGATSFEWSVPDVVASDAILTVDVTDPFGARASDSSGPFGIVRPQPFGEFALVLGILALILVGALILIGYLYASRRLDAAGRPKASPPTAPGGPTEPGTVGVETPESPPEGKKVCPQCGTAVHKRDWTCFYCGFRFPEPPT